MPRSQRQGKRASNSRKQARAVTTRNRPWMMPPVVDRQWNRGSGAGPLHHDRTRPAGRRRRPGRWPWRSTLPREQEYAFIREDLVRLLITSGILTVVMIALLLVVDR